MSLRIDWNETACTENMSYPCTEYIKTMEYHELSTGLSHHQHRGNSTFSPLGGIASDWPTYVPKNMCRYQKQGRMHDLLMVGGGVGGMGGTHRSVYGGGGGERAAAPPKE